jgi:hypothetical protein
MELTAFKKFRFRVAFYFFIIYFFPNPYLYFPFYSLYPKWLKAPVDWINEVFGYVEKFWQLSVPWVGKHVVHLKEDITVFTNGSGDTTYDYIKVFTVLFISLLLAMLWWRLDKKIVTYKKLNYWFTVFIRYFLAMNLLSYGFSKMFHIQMPSPDLGRLMQPYGESSPMGITWTFLGLSKGYSFFIGFSEVFAGILLLFRRTLLTGAILSVLVMFNVFVINLCFDVPVKVYSFFLTFMGLYLAWPYLQKLYHFFYTHKQDNATLQPQEVYHKKYKKFFLIVKFLLLIDLLGLAAYDQYQTTYEYGDNVPKSDLYGIYEINHFIVNNDTILPLATDSTRWQYIAFDNRRKGDENIYCRIAAMNNKKLAYRFDRDSVNKQNFTLTNRADSTLQYKLQIIKIDSIHYNLKGSFGKDSVLFTSTKKDLSKFLLTNTKFRWINEYPFNR